MKYILVAILFAIVADVSAVQHEVIEKLAQRTMEEISRQTNENMDFVQLVSFNKKRNYNSVYADWATRLSLRMDARRSDGELVDCQADIDVLDTRNTLSIKSYGCQQQQGAFQRRSGESPCSAEESNSIRQEALHLMNNGVDELNAEFGSLGMDAPMTGKYSNPVVQTCTKVDTGDGVEYKLKMQASQNNQNMNCDITMLKGENGKYDLTQNQCQGMS
uniref:Uncharacterized protein n=1 Tax=Ciona savignyi TaxID=51511 RepID=H2Z5X6_CIOSA